MGLKTMALYGRRSVVANGHGNEMVLQIGVFNARITADKSTGLHVVGRAQAAAIEHPLHANTEFGQRTHRRVQGYGLLAAHLHIGFHMVLQIFTDTAQGDGNWQVQRFKQARVPNARELQELRRIDCATAQNDFASGSQFLQLAVMQCLHTHRAHRIPRTLQNHLGVQYIFLQTQIVPLERWTQIGHCRTPAAPFVRGHVHRSQAFLLVAIHIFGDGVTRLFASLNKCPIQRISHGRSAYLERPLMSPIGITTDTALLSFFEVRQAMGI